MMTKHKVLGVCILALFGAVDVDAQDQKLLGCWVTERAISYYEDSLPSRNRSNCVLYFEEDQVTSACNSKQGVSLITYFYKIVRPGVYEATMETNDRLPALIGSVREYDYQIANGKLFITTYPQTTKPAQPDKTVRFESISNFKSSISRKDCQTFSNSELLNAAAEISQ